MPTRTENLCVGLFAATSFALVSRARGLRVTPASMTARAPVTTLDEKAKNGAFVRTASTHRDFVSSKPGAKYPAQSGRYHLYVSYACPWANRVLAVRALKGLEDCISVSVVHPTWQKTKPSDPDDPHWGWVFNADPDVKFANKAGNGELTADAACTVDHINGLSSIRDVYEHAKSEAPKFSVPVFFDKETQTIVNNESEELVRMLNTEFNEFAKDKELDLYPEDLRKQIDEVNSWVYPTINNGVYRCGFAQSQVAYDEAVSQLFGSLDRVEEILSKQRYIAGDRFTEADLRLFMTLARFDEVYVVYFKCNARMLMQYDNIRNYCRELYQMPKMASVINMDHIKQHYYTSHAALNTYAVIPTGPGAVADMLKPHDRDRF